MKLSIITPSFNQGRFLEQTIKSVVSQKGKFESEYLIFDGGSTDKSLQIIKHYASRYPTISYHIAKDRGQVDALNQGLKQATGDVVAYLNSDDYYLPGSFSAVANYLSAHPNKRWLVGNCRVSQKNLRWTFFLKTLWPVDRFRAALQIFNTINQPAVFLTRKLIKQIGLFNQKYHYAFDYDYWLRCSKVALPDRLHRDLAIFRIHPASKGNTAYQRQFQEDFQIIRKHTGNSLIIYLHWLILKI